MKDRKTLNEMSEMSFCAPNQPCTLSFLRKISVFREETHVINQRSKLGTRKSSLSR